MRWRGRACVGFLLSGLLVLVLAGCARFQELVSPRPPAAPSRVLLKKKSPPRREKKVRPAVRPESPPVEEEEEKKAPPVRPESPPAAEKAKAKEKATVPAPVLSPQLDPLEERRVEQQADTRIKSAEQVVTRIDPGKLSGDQRETFSIIQSFLADGKKALSAREFQRALNLADKAYLLARQLLQSVH